MNLEDLQKRALEIREKYEQLETERYGRSWSNEELTLGFVGDVGDLVKLVQAQEGVRDIEDSKAKLGHELADCLWSILVLADKYDVDLAKAFVKTMNELEARFES